MEVADAYEIFVNIEPHGYFTTKPEMMEKMQAFCGSKYLRMNMDTGFGRCAQRCQNFKYSVLSLEF